MLTLNDVVWNVTDVVNVKKHDLQFVDHENVRVFMIIFLDFQMKSLLYLMEQNTKLQIY